MSSVLHRRMARLEAALMPRLEQLRDIRLLAQPDDNDPPEAWVRHSAELASIKQSGGMAIVLVAMRPKQGLPIDGKSVRYVGNETEAQILALSLQPSEIGDRSQLDDVLAGLSGNALGVVADPIDSKDDNL